MLTGRIHILSSILVTMTSVSCRMGHGAHGAFIIRESFIGYPWTLDYDDVRGQSVHPNADIDIREMPYTQEPIIIDETNYRAMVREITASIALRSNEKSVSLKRDDDAVDYDHLSAIIAMIHKACPINKKAERFGKNGDITMMYDIAFQLIFSPELELQEVLNFGKSCENDNGIVITNNQSCY